MTTGEAKAQEVRNNVIPPDSEQNSRAEFVETLLEKEIFVKEKLASNLKVKERFSRLKKSLKKKSVSIL